ncbi:MAG: outer membrane beta-barrel protein [Gammaproteobacteria bacterium]|nr:outer membrane beta-barrel protein [Gammaproteobacteria bacterium]
MFFFRITRPILLIFCCGFTYAESTGKTPGLQQLQLSTSPWHLDTGIRYWLGDNKFAWDLYNIAGDELVSRITYQGVTTNSAEGFWRLQHQNGIFFKGYVGAGSNLNGESIDEDFLPTTTPYSRTISEQKQGRLSYFSFDLGYTLYEQAHYKLSPFIGYHYWFTHYNSFGCKQTASNPSCLIFSYPTTIDTLNDQAAWNALRLGLNGEVQLLDNLTFVVDAAYTYAYLLANDYHNLRPDIRGEFFEGTGNGLQLDMVFDWLATPNLSMGLGARLWTIKTKGHSHFEETASEGRAQHTDTKQTNIGLLVQSNYRFEDTKKSLSSTDKDGLITGSEHWSGLFLGANLGYGTSFNNVSVLPFESTPLSLVDVSPFLIHLQSSGFLGGGQVGYNWIRNKILLGVESDINYASVGGTNSITFTPTLYQVNSSVTQALNWFGTVRGRLGRVASDTLLPYLTAGLLFSNTEISYTQTVLFLNQPILQTNNSHTETNLNWVAGAGLEYAVSDHFSYKLEYLYLDLGDLTLNSTYYALDSKFASNMIRLGINYHPALQH